MMTAVYFCFAMSAIVSAVAMIMMTWGAIEKKLAGDKMVYEPFSNVGLAASLIALAFSIIGAALQIALKMGDTYGA